MDMASLNLLTGLIGMMLLGHIKKVDGKHWGVDHHSGTLKPVSRKQYLHQKLYFWIEPKVVLPLTDFLLRSKFFTQTRLGLKLLTANAKANANLPHGMPVTHSVIMRYVDFLDKQYGPEGYRFTIGPCICQKTFNRWQEPVLKDIQFLYAGDAWMDLKKGGFRWATLGEVKDVLRTCHEAGLVHQLDFCNMSGDWTFCICNCEKKICAQVRAYNVTGYGCLQGPEECVVDTGKCLGVEACGVCIDKCHFNAIPVLDGKAGLDTLKCPGCGICVDTCPAGARTMIVRKDYRYNDIYPQEMLLGEERMKEIGKN